MDNVILAFDPGPHTGIACLTNGSIHWVSTATADSSPSAVYQRIHALLSHDDVVAHRVDLTVVCERFVTVSPAVSASHDGIMTMHIAGFIEGMCCVNALRLVWQSPAERKPFLDMSVGALGNAQDKRHERDALAHALAFIWKESRRVAKEH